MLGLNYSLAEFSTPALPLYISLATGIFMGIFLFVNLREKVGVKYCNMLMAAVWTFYNSDIDRGIWFWNCVRRRYVSHSFDEWQRY